ncbi:hypothetical protein FISHEDRAFT_34214 [Fistulina hepatica ATCC 64428]|uniref:Nudix hydrolase domain-containing protein n=1 Tax=Fistulina hepatica ATCC 64428 TaxID=1128425 RepID=A0A0D7AQ96_9AGAR|nr:hypothetical protein FISHEDRAFT_34214 [Fistulina hepatica ATCC 64428]
MDGFLCSENLMIGAGMVIFQVPSDPLKVVLVYEKRRKYWFLPKGRKDVGEAVEQTAVREAFEEVHHENTGMPDEVNYESHILNVLDGT